MKTFMKWAFYSAVAVLFWFSLLAIDQGWFPVILCVASWAILALAAHKNGWYYDPERDEADV